MDYKILKIRFLTSLIIILFLSISLLYTKIIFLFTSIIYLLILIEIFNNFKFKNIIYLYVYILTSLFSFFYFLIWNYNIYFFIYLILLVIIFDISSYLLGSLYGEKKILRKISPKKTIFGSFAGYVVSIIATIPFYIFFFEVHFFLYFIISTLIIMLSFIGDLTESYFKRLSNIKDSSNYLPGHGGFFDRFDSFIFVVIFINILNYFIS